MVPVWEDTLPPPANPCYPLRFDIHEILPEIFETLPMSQWAGELDTGIQHEHNVRIVLQYAEPRTFSIR